jgi:acyl-CoA synthetase (AMP-forming)/AMP-acid ligase II
MSAPALMRAGYMLSWPATRYPDRVALSYQGQNIAFREVDERVNRLANALIDLGLRRGDRVAALLANSPRAIETRFALMKAGLCMVALNVRQAPEEHAYILEHAEARLLVVDPEYLPIWEQIGPQCRSVGQVIVAASEPAGHLAYEAVIAAASPVAPEVLVSPDDLERIAYTSGTTGLPKGIIKTIGNDLARLRNDFMNEERPTTADDVMLNVAPLTHAARVFARKHYLKGARNIILRHFEAEEVLATIQRERVTTAMFVPTMIVRLVRHPGVRAYDTSSLRRVFFGTAPMPADTFRQAIEIFGNVFRQNYGLSEATQPVLSLTPADLVRDDGTMQLQRLASAGRPVNGVEVRLVDDNGRDTAPDEAGELLIRGDIVMPGYWKDPQATREVLDADGWLHTGDIARRDAAGYVYIVDRKKDMIISGGFNVYPREVECVIESHASVQEVAVIGVPDDVWGEVVTAVVVPRLGARLVAEEVIALCRAHIASYKSPKAVHFVDDLPKSFQGKILKRVLRERYGQERPIEDIPSP